MAMSPGECHAGKAVAMRNFLRTMVCCIAVATLAGGARTAASEPVLVPSSFSFSNQEKGLGPEYQISVSSNPETDRYVPATAYDAGRGRTLVVWHRHGGGSYYIEGRLLDSAGRPMGGGPTVLASGATPVYQPTVAYNATEGGYLVAWMRNSSMDGKTYDVWGKIIDYNLVEVHAEFQLMAADTNYSFWTPRAAWNSQANEYMVAANSFEISGWPAIVPSSIRERTLYSDGGLINPFMVVIYNEPGKMIYPQSVNIVYHPTGVGYGQYVWVWKQVKHGTADYDIWAANIDAELGGWINTLPPWPVDTSTYDQTTPRIATDGQNHFLVVWSERSPVGVHDWDIRGREMNNIGTLGANTHIIAGTGSTDETDPFVTAFPNAASRFAVGYQRKSDTGTGIWLAYYNGTANTLDASGYRFWLDYFPVADFAFWDNYYPAGVAGGPKVQIAYEGVSNTPGDHIQIYSRLWTPFMAFMPLVTRH